MPLIIKPRTLGLLHKIERRRNGARFVASVIAAFDLADSSKLDGEQSLWLMAAEALPEGSALDTCMPKPRAEILIAGKIQAPQSNAVLLEARIAGMHKRLAVFGDRWWTVANGRYVATEPRPLDELLLSPKRAFGGPGHPANAAGLGFGAPDLLGKGEPVQLPNIENPDTLIHAIDDLPAPAGFGPLDVMDPQRQRLAGTYDAAWVRDVYPALADDIHPDFFMTAPEGQRLPTYLTGDEPYTLHNFSAKTPVIEGRLPGVVPRAFIGQNDGKWSEMTLALDTVWLVAGARRGILVWHGVAPVADIQGKDVSDVMLAYERLGEPPRPIEHYAEVRRLRCDPETALRYAFSEWQLSPPRDPADEARRKAARMALAQQSAAKRAEMMAFATTRMLDEVGLPEALRPPPPGSDEPPILLPFPTPEELAEGDFDLGDMLDIVEEQKAKSDEEIRRVTELGMPVIEAMKAMNAPGAGTKEVDALLASITPLVGSDLGSGLDKAFAQIEMPPLDETGDGSSPADMEADAERIRDWRALLVEGLKGDDETLLAEAKARFLQLPESSPFAEARAAIAEVAGRPAPDLPDLADGASREPPAPSNTQVSALLDDLLSDPAVSPDFVAESKQKMAAANAQISQSLPGLAAAGGGSPVDALLAEIGKMSLAPAGGSPGLGDANTQVTTQLEELNRQLDEAEVRLTESMATVRLMSLKAGFPHIPMPLRISKRFGDSVLEHIRAGLSLAGRDLAGVDLAGADLSGLDLSGAYLERANLANARLCGANLTKATLTEARLEYADFSDAQLTGANLSSVNGRGMRLDGTQLSNTMILEASFAGASARRAKFAGTQFMDVDFSGADFSEARFEGSIMMRITAIGARFERATLRECQVLEADLTDAHIDGAFLDRCAFLKLTAPGLSAVGADVRGSSFLGGAKLAGADFSEGFVSDAGFFGADLTGARFRRAICDRSMFSEGQMEGADFHLASLRRSILDSANLANADFIGAQLMEAQLHRAILKRARFQGANLFGADLTDADLMAADLTGAHLARSPLDLETVHA
ncbi:DUF2169 domain-containing protein [Aquabacter sp. CN5-332]|uniref:DUF2169 family type VI secretion system accessory protein n=1 Tax=Aquabacter sp. CN5-332 TaxID=3156608 RepID=UPI0032B34695